MNVVTDGTSMNGCDCVPIKHYFLKQAASRIQLTVCGLPTPELAKMGLQAGGRAAGDLRRLSMTRSWEAAPEPWRARCLGAALVGAGSGWLSYASVLGPPTVYAQPSNQRDAVTTKSVPVSSQNQGQGAYCG